MTNNTLFDFQSALLSLRETINEPFWNKADFWINFFIGIIGLIAGIIGIYYARKAFVEAEKAKQAATEAAKVVKIQTTAIELSEILQKLEKLDPSVEYQEARELLNEVSRRLLRATAPFAKEVELSEIIRDLRVALTATKTALNALRPTNVAVEAQGQQTVYFGIEGDFANITNIVADLLGLFENLNIKNK